MSVKIPLYVNDEMVGAMTVTRMTKNLPPGNAEDTWRTHQYRWDAVQYSPGDYPRRTSGTAWHVPDDGIWKLIAECTKKVPGYVMSRA